MCKVRPTKVEISEGQLLCVVCNDIGNGVHFGAVTCEGCKVRRLLCCENCPHSETKPKRNSFKTVSKLFCFSFMSLCAQFYVMMIWLVS